MGRPRQQNINRCATLHGRIRAARRDFDDAVERTFKPGHVVAWRHGNTVRHGEVIDVSKFGGKLKVKGWHSDGYWIDVYRVLEFMSNG